MIDPTLDRQRRAEAMANAQIPGLESHKELPVPKHTAPAETPSGVVSSTPARDVIDVSGAPIEKPTDAEIERITEDVIGQLKSVYDPEIPTDIYELGLIYKVCLLYTSPSPRDRQKSRMPSSA